MSAWNRGRCRGRSLEFESLESRLVLSASALPLSAPALEAAVVQAPAISQDITLPASVALLNYWEFGQLTSLTAPLLSAQQVASIPDRYWLGQIPTAARAALTAAQVPSLRVAAVGLELLTPQQVSWLTAAQIQSLKYYDFQYLAPSQIKWLTAAQISTIPSTASFAEWSAASRAALSGPQVQALNVDNVFINLLTPQQRAALSTAQIRSLNYWDFQYLAPYQIPWLTTAQIASIIDGAILPSWSDAARAALTYDQIRTLPVDRFRIDWMTSQQISWLTAAQIQSLKYYDFQYLAPSQIRWLTAAQISTIPSTASFAEWSAASRAALSGPQVQALNVDNVFINLLTPVQRGALTAAQLRSLNYWDFQYLAPNQIPVLTTAQIASIIDGAILPSWSDAARAALTYDQIRTLPVDRFRIDWMTSQQASWLTAAQIQSLNYYDFQYLQPAQIKWLTTAQISTIPSTANFAEWSAASRAALSGPQVQALNVANVYINLLTSPQRAALSTAQIRSLNYWDFQYLPAYQIPALTIAQIASITDGAILLSWSDAARAALTYDQIRTLPVDRFRIDWMTSQQASWLTAAQIQSLNYYDFQYLQPAQIRWLTTAQISTIPSTANFAEWSAASRAALSAPQVQALNVANVYINLLTSPQRAALSTAQIRSLNYWDFQYLPAYQIPVLTPAQFEKVPSPAILTGLSLAAQAELTQSQLLALPLPVWAGYAPLSQALYPPTDYMPVVDMPTGPDGLGMDDQMMAEAAAVFNLVPISSATHATIASGNWSDPRIWRNGVVPGQGAKALISAGTVVTYDQYASTALSTLRIDGTLEFASDRNTQILVDTIVVYTTGKLHIGTSANPIRNNVSARIIIPDNGPINAVWDPSRVSRGLISRGEVRMFGKSVTPYVTLLQMPSVGSTQLVLAQIPLNWSVGDKIVLTGTQQYAEDGGTEELTIRAVNGNVVTVDPLRFSHQPPAGFGLKVYVANLSRNIIFQAADPSVAAERPHMWFIHNPDVDVENIQVNGFGRTDKTIPIGTIVNGVANPRGRYAMHFHHEGVDPMMDPAVVRGSVVIDSPGWGYVNHSSNVVMENNIAYKVVGSSFVTEDGNEIGVMRGNLSIDNSGSGDHIEARNAIHDFGHEGDGFWFQGPGVQVVNNIAVGAAHAGFIFFTASSKNLFDAVNLANPSLAKGHDAVPVGSVPLSQVKGNVALNSGFGLEVWFHMTTMPEGETIIEDFTSWNTRYGIDLRYSGNVTFRNTLLIGDLTNYKGVGIASENLTRDITYENVRIDGFEIGIDAPLLGATTIDGGRIKAVQAIYIEKGDNAARSVSVIRQPTYETLNASQLRGRQQYQIYATGQFDPETIDKRTAESFLAQDSIIITFPNNIEYQVVYYEQGPRYVPFPADRAAGFAPPEYLNKTNKQLWNEFGVTFGGELSPSGVTSVPGIYGLIRQIG